MSEHSKVFDVIVAGAGPVGLFLACELRLAGVSVLVLEQSETSSSPLKRTPFGIRGLSVPSVEILDRRGLLDALLAAEARSVAAGGATALHWQHQARKPGGHFAGIQFFHDKINTSRWPYRLPRTTAMPMPATMENIETVLEARASVLGTEILRNAAVDHIEQAADMVTVTAAGRRFDGRWLIGCDGGRSRVRKLSGFEFVGTDPEFTGYSVQVTLADPDKLPAGRHYTPTGMYTFHPPGTVAMIDFDGGAFHRTQPVSVNHVQDVLRRISGVDVVVTELALATTWTDRAYQATAYKRGRVLLAGDAAHVHSPLGGQGLNLGLGDAMNLGWKLAVTIRGEAPVGLLDTYMTERHPVGEAVLDWSRAQVALMRPSRSSRALEAIFRDLIDTEDGATYFANRVWGTALRYDLGDAHPLVGTSAPNFKFTDGSRLSDHLRDGKAVLLDFDASPARQRWAADIRGLSYVGADVHDRLGLNALLARPDGVVSWISEDGNFACFPMSPFVRSA